MYRTDRQTRPNALSAAFVGATKSTILINQWILPASNRSFVQSTQIYIIAWPHFIQGRARYLTAFKGKWSHRLLMAFCKKLNGKAVFFTDFRWHSISNASMLLINFYSATQSAVCYGISVCLLMGDDPVQVKFECKRSTPCENNRAVHISPHNFETIRQRTNFN